MIVKSAAAQIDSQLLLGSANKAEQGPWIHSSRQCRCADAASVARCKTEVVTAGCCSQNSSSAVPNGTRGTGGSHERHISEESD